MTRRPKQFLIISFAAIALMVVGMRATFLSIEYRATMDRGAAATRDMASITEEFVRRVFDTSDLAAEAVLAEARSRGSLAAMANDSGGQRFLAALAEKLAPDSAIWLIGANGRPVVMSDQSQAIDADLRDRDWWHALAERGEDRYVGEAIIGRVYKGIFYTYARRVTDADGRFAGVILLVLRPPTSQALRFPGEVGANAAIAVYRRDGHLVSRVPIDEGMIGLDYSDTPLFQHLQRGSVGSYRAVSSTDGVDRLVSYRRLDNWPVTVLAAASVDAVLAPWYDSLRASAMLLTAILVGLSLLTWLGVRSMRREERGRRETEAARHAAEQANQRLAAALADKDVLFQEVHHRVKNNLQVITGLLLMQARQFDDPALRAAFQETANRVRSMGLVHETLYATGEAAEVRLGDYLRRLVEGIAAGHATAERGIRVSLDLADCTVNLDQAIPIALMTTEVVINALKHAFPSGQGGELGMSLRCASEGVTIQVRDTGPGMPDTVRKGSLGMTLIRALSEQIGARYRFVNENGTVFSLSIPSATPTPAMA